MDKKTYKACLEVNLIGDNKVSIEILYLDDTLLLTNDDVYNIVVHRNKKNNFCIWSSMYFVFCENYFRFPGYMNNNMKIIHTHDYITDEKRKIGLKKLYDSLQTWSCDKKIFINNYSDINNNNVEFVDNYWFIK